MIPILVRFVDLLALACTSNLHEPHQNKNHSLYYYAIVRFNLIPEADGTYLLSLILHCTCIYTDEVYTWVSNFCAIQV